MIETCDGLETEDWRITQARERLVLLRGLAQLGVCKVEALARGWCDLPLDLATAYVRFSRAVRVVITLERRIADELDALLAGALGPVPPLPLRAREPEPEPKPEPKPEPEPEPKPEPEPEETATAEAAAPEAAPREADERPERLFERERFDAYLRLPFEEAVRRICRLLGQDPEPYLRRLTVFDQLGRLRVAMVRQINHGLSTGEMDLDDAERAMDVLAGHMQGEDYEVELTVPYAAIEKRRAQRALRPP